MNEQSDLSNGKKTEKDKSRKDFFQSVDIPMFVKRLTFLYVLLKIIAAVMTIVKAVESSTGAGSIITYVADQLFGILLALIVWGGAQLLTLLRNTK